MLLYLRHRSWGSFFETWTLTMNGSKFSYIFLKFRISDHINEAPIYISNRGCYNELSLIEICTPKIPSHLCPWPDSSPIPLINIPSYAIISTLKWSNVNMWNGHSIEHTHWFHHKFTHRVELGYREIRSTLSESRLTKLVNARCVKIFRETRP